MGQVAKTIVIRPLDVISRKPDEGRRARIEVEAGRIGVFSEDAPLRQQIEGFVQRFFVPAAGFPKLKRNARGEPVRSDDGRVEIEGYVAFDRPDTEILAAIRDNLELTGCYDVEPRQREPEVSEVIELEGDVLKRYLADAVAAKDRERALTLDRARRQAPEGKEPFSLEVLERYYALGSVFTSDPPADREARGRELEYLYYVVYRTVLNLKEFAGRLEQGDRYR